MEAEKDISHGQLSTDKQADHTAQGVAPT
jgi:hypothetical protein